MRKKLILPVLLFASLFFIAACETETQPDTAVQELQTEIQELRDDFNTFNEEWGTFQEDWGAFREGGE